MTDKSCILVIGYGLMGQGIVRSFCAAGFEVRVHSRRRLDPANLPEGAVQSEGWPQPAPALAIETIIEEAEAKRRVFAELEAAYGPDLVIGTNTSGLPLEELAQGMRHPDRLIGTHYFMPADIFPMVEIVGGPATPPAILETVATLMRRTGKEPILLAKPITGYVINRLQHSILHEAYHLVASGVASPATIDAVAKRLLGPRLCVTGLIEQKDLGGLAIHAEAQRAIVPALDHSGVPNPLLQNLVVRGETGADAGQGFYDWRGLDAKSLRAVAARQLVRLLDFLEGEPARAAPKPRDLNS